MGWLARLLGTTSRERTDPPAAPSPPSDPHAILSAPLLYWSEQDAFTLGDATQGVQVFGASGSGKTSGSGQAIARAYLDAGFGGLVLCAKPDEADLWRRYCHETDRTADLLVMQPGGSHCFNFLDYELRHNDGAGFVENVVQLFLKALEAGGRSARGNSADPYWETALAELLRNTISLIYLTGTAGGLAEMHKVVASAPTSPELALDPAWQQDSECGLALLVAEGEAQSRPELAYELEQTASYWRQTFPSLAEKTRSIIVQSFTAAADSLLRPPMRQLFCGATTITPEDSFRGRILLLDLSLKTYGEVGRFAQILFKLCWQRAAERRRAADSPLPVFLWADEAQYFLGRSDQQFLTTARSARVCTVLLTQNLPNYYTEFGDKKSMAHSLLGNLSTKIFHANGDEETNEWASKTIASVWERKMSVSGSSIQQQDGQQGQTGYSMAEQMVAQVMPHEFHQLRTGGPDNGRLVDGIVFSSARRFVHTEKNYLHVTFSQTTEGG